MQDRFKFRLWDKEKKFMITEDKYDETEKLYGKDEAWGCLEYDAVNPFSYYEEKFVVQQSTGLKDKNGRLIYEGDIVKNGLHNDLVEWYKGGFWVNGFINGAKWNIHYSHQNLEVIGNIYETPELLESN